MAKLINIINLALILISYYTFSQEYVFSHEDMPIGVLTPLLQPDKHKDYLKVKTEDFEYNSENVMITADGVGGYDFNSFYMAKLFTLELASMLETRASKDAPQLRDEVKKVVHTSIDKYNGIFDIEKEMIINLAHKIIGENFNVFSQNLPLELRRNPEFAPSALKDEINETIKSTEGGYLRLLAGGSTFTAAYLTNNEENSN